MTVMIGSRPAKDALFDGFARVAASLGSGRRLEIVDVLAQAPRTVEDLAAAIGQSVANTSHHLRRMATDGLVVGERQGRQVQYRLASHHVRDLWRAVQGVAAEHHDGLEEKVVAYLGDRNEIMVLDREAALQRMQDPTTIVIDVRPLVEYEAGHLAGAVNVPPDQLEVLLSGLPGGDVVAYCRGRYCSYADQAVRLLVAAGRTAYRMDDGYHDWERPAG
ncbi:MAG: metalloregulator ArsR/SmtB family transcription factor [Acidimicrobiia bacterium]|nr:metalloregulator ArsR/SmtB family transcription factor [Acidimicrobiia bacterium]